MRCPTAEHTNVMYADLSSENLLKGNYVACWGGGAFIDGTPDGKKVLSGLFGVVPITAKYPSASGWRSARGPRWPRLSTALQTRLCSGDPELDPGHGRSHVDYAVRIEQGRPRAHADPNGRWQHLHDQLPAQLARDRPMASCETTIPVTNPMACNAPAIQTMTDSTGLPLAAGTGRPNATMGDGSVRFIKSSISRAVWIGLGPKGGGEIISADAY